MIFLVYVSSAKRPFTRADLLALLAQSRARNAAAGLTGMLLYNGGNFMQVLEGPEEAVNALYAKIGRDPRHSGLMTLLRGPLAARQFADWSMAFCNLDEDEAQAVPGYSDFLNTPLTSVEFAADPSRSQKLLLSFKNSMR